MLFFFVRADHMVLESEGTQAIRKFTYNEPLFSP